MLWVKKEKKKNKAREIEHDRIRDRDNKTKVYCIYLCNLWRVIAVITDI